MSEYEISQQESDLLWALQAGTVFDWITPSIGFYEDIANDSLIGANTWTFFFNYRDLLAAGYDPATIETMLRQHGIKHWGSQLTLNEFFVCVRVEQASDAENIFSYFGIPMKELSRGAPVEKPVDEGREAIWDNLLGDLSFGT